MRLKIDLKKLAGKLQYKYYKLKFTIKKERINKRENDEITEKN